MGKGGLEPPRLAAHDPKSCSSANSDTPPDRKLENTQYQLVNYWLTPELLNSFLASRRQGISKHTIKFYHNCLKKFIGHPLTAQGITEFLNNLTCSNGKHAYFRAIRALCNWLVKNDYLKESPLKKVDAPKPGKPILPSLTTEQVGYLINYVDNLRDKAIISLFADSGVRLN